MPIEDSVRGARGWPATVAFLAVALPPVVAVLSLRRIGVPELAWAPYLNVALVQPLVLAAAAVVYVHWRISAEDGSRWATVALTGLGVPGLVNGAAMVAHPDTVVSADLRRMTVHVVVVLVALTVALIDVPDRFSLDPVVVGISLGSLLALGSAVVLSAGPAPTSSTMLTSALAVVPVLVATVFAAVLVIRGPLPAWGHIRLAIGVLLLAIGQTDVLTSVEGRGPALVTAAAGAVLLGSTTVTLVAHAIAERGREVTELYERLYDVERRDREQRARLHEISSTVVGLASASRLVTDAGTMSSSRRSEMQALVHLEVERLERIVTAENLARQPFELDDVLRPLVLTQVARGNRIVWVPTGHRVEARPDDVAEIVGILLDNAARHGGGTRTDLVVRRLGSTVEVAVCDDGRGLPDDVRGRLFDWGGRGGGSQGQGIGLNVARRLALHQGGYLVLEDHPGPGTTFVVGLRSADPVEADVDEGVRSGEHS